MSLLVLPFSLFAVVSQDWMYSGHWCEIQGFFFTSVIAAQQLALLIISIDRNYAIMNSLRYPNVFTQTLCSILIVFSWTFAVIISIPPLLSSGMGNYVFHQSQFLCGLDWESDLNYLVVFSLMAFGLPVFIQSFCYIKIFIAAVGHSKRSSKVKPWPGRPSRTTSELRSDSSTCSSEYSEEVYQSSVECKAVKTIFIIAFAYSVCWVPYFTDSFLTMKKAEINPNYSAAAICCLFSSSILNPMIYAYMNRVTRREIGRFVCGNSGIGDSDEAGSTSMSAYSAWTQGRIRSKSNGAMTNEMDTIMEETEVEETVFGESRSDNRCKIACKADASVKSSKSVGSGSTKNLIFKGEKLFNIDRKGRFETELKIPEIRELNSPEASGSHNEQMYQPDKKKLKESAWSVIKTEKFNKELRRSSQTNESYFAKGKRRRKRDFGSFLYFESNNKHSEASRYTKSEKERKGTHRYSVDHVQSISVGRIPSLMKFRLSLHESDLKNLNKVTVKSNFEFENNSYETEENLTLTDCPLKPTESSVPSPPQEQPIEFGLNIPHDFADRNVKEITINTKRREITSNSESLVVTKPLVARTSIYKNNVSQRRINSAPAALLHRQNPPLLQRGSNETQEFSKTVELL